MREYLELGATPCDESCVQVGSDNYRSLALKECRRYQEMLETMFPDFEKFDCQFVTKEFSHDFGQYHEVCITYDCDNPESIGFAFAVESNLPATWNNPSVLATFIRTGNMTHLESYKYD